MNGSVSLASWDYFRNKRTFKAARNFAPLGRANASLNCAAAGPITVEHFRVSLRMAGREFEFDRLVASITN